MLKGVYDIRIAVTHEGQALVINLNKEQFKQYDHWLDWIDCNDNGFRNIPTETGVYDCKVEHHVYSYDEYDCD